MALTFTASRIDPGVDPTFAYTHSDVNIGLAADDRWVFVATGNSNGASLQSITVGGVALSPQASGESSFDKVFIYAGNVPASAVPGNLATIVVTHSEAAWASIGVWSANGDTLELVDEHGGSAGLGRASAATTLNTADGGFAIAAGWTSTSPSYVGITEQYDFKSGFYNSGAHIASTDGDPTDISIVTQLFNIHSCWVVASFRLAPFGPGGSGADGIFDANGSHIIRECLVNTDWGMGASPASLDDTSFRTAADTLYYDEVFGLSMIWTKQAPIESFIGEVLDHIEAALFLHPRTGLITLKLIRDDYDPNTLPVISPANAQLSNWGRKGWGEIVNEIVVSWTNPDSEEAETVNAQDLAALATQGGIISETRDYYGVRRGDLAMKLAHRDLRAAATPLATCDAVLDRTMWDLVPADVVKLDWPEYGLSGLIMRVGPVDYGAPGTPTIKVTLAEDVFGLDQGAFFTPPGSEWTDPREDPATIAFTELLTLPYWTVVQVIGATAAQGAVYPDSAAGVLAAQTGSDTSSYDLMTEVTDAAGVLSFEVVALRPILSRGELEEPPLVSGVLPAGALDEEAESVVAIPPRTQGDPPAVAGLVFIGTGGDEAMELAMVTAVTATEMTLQRGVLDTVPQKWPVGTPVWFVNADLDWYDPTERAAGETARYKILPRTSGGVLDQADAAIIELVVGDRPHLPSRPADVKVNGIGFGIVDSTATDPVTVTVAERNRLTEDSQILAWDDATVTPEASQTWKVELLNTVTRAVIATVSGLTGTSTTIAHTVFAGNNEAIFRVTADRDGFESLQGHEITVLVATPDYTADTNLVTADTDELTADFG